MSLLCDDACLSFVEPPEFYTMTDSYGMCASEIILFLFPSLNTDETVILLAAW